MLATSSSDYCYGNFRNSKTEDIQSGHPADPAVWSEDLDGVQEAGKKTQPLPPQPSSMDIEAGVAGPDPGHGRTGTNGALSIHVMLAQLQLRWSDHLMRMDDQRSPKRLLYGDIATSSRRQVGQDRRFKDTLATSLRRLKIDPANGKTSLKTDRPGGEQ
ncbi:hypothetical protein SprV_0100511800 [Sparganum proliferum]